MSEHGFIAFSMKITASAQAPCQDLPSLLTRLIYSPSCFFLDTQITSPASPLS